MKSLRNDTEKLWRIPLKKKKEQKTQNSSSAEENSWFNILSNLDNSAIQLYGYFQQSEAWWKQNN